MDIRAVAVRECSYAIIARRGRRRDLAVAVRLGDGGLFVGFFERIAGFAFEYSTALEASAQGFHRPLIRRQANGQSVALGRALHLSRRLAGGQEPDRCVVTEL